MSTIKLLESAQNKFQKVGRLAAISTGESS